MAIPFEHKPNTGSFFKNNRKTKSNHPDYKGSAKIDGVDYWVNIWGRMSSENTPFFGITFTPQNGDVELDTTAQKFPDEEGAEAQEGDHE
ncbi:hypothetical protein [Methylovorus mays]|jgi:hypothetical protein|uniref:hypothetical protein n=1 Tax=Methylovorus mays TaxID=184077 RepID=UPI001E312FED|nr:hypothetical protein [Methylovorus mays]MCB5207798.1 hypothetical protein [Methylovorus mays]